MHKDDARPDGSATATREIDRRTIAKGVAWSVPVVIVATAAPAAATSGMAATPALSTASIDSHLNGRPSFRFTGSTVSNESGTIEFLTLTQGSNTLTISKVRPLIVGTNNFDITLVPPFEVVPGSISIAFKILDSDGKQRRSGSLSANVPAYTTVVAVGQQGANGNSSLRTLTFTFGTPNPKSALVVQSVKDSAGTAWTELSQKEWEDIGSGTVYLTARRPSNGAAAVVKGTIDGQPFEKSA